MSLFSIDIHCKACDHRWDDLVERELLYPDSRFYCPECSEPAGERAISAPHSTKASYVDGTKRFTDLKEAAKLNKQKAVSKGETKKELAREIKKLGARLEK